MDKKIRPRSVKALEFLTQELTSTQYYNWGLIVDLLVTEFNWTPKTCSNRIHELIELGYLERVGKFEKPTPRRKGGHDLRQVKIISQITLKSNNK